MLRGHESKSGRQGNDLRFEHHRTSGVTGLKTSAKEGCCFCYVIWLSLSKLDQAIIDGTEYIETCLFDVKDEQGLYRLEFNIPGHPLATFLLEQTSQSHHTQQLLSGLDLFLTIEVQANRNSQAMLQQTAQSPTRR
jgi:hypothetical protein